MKILHENNNWRVIADDGKALIRIDDERNVSELVEVVTDNEEETKIFRECEYGESPHTEEPEVSGENVPT